MVILFSTTASDTSSAAGARFCEGCGCAGAPLISWIWRIVISAFSMPSWSPRDLKRSWASSAWKRPRSVSPSRTRLSPSIRMAMASPCLSHVCLKRSLASVAACTDALLRPATAWHWATEYVAMPVICLSPIFRASAAASRAGRTALASCSVMYRMASSSLISWERLMMEFKVACATRFSISTSALMSPAARASASASLALFTASISLELATKRAVLVFMA
mmetsp:Transcript_93609/g.222545  ORF Transcript_93609/g.222545 Transcript_93609/m.222545 type:complete len:221 (+) Transcript_93609:293-955(+)